MLINHLRTVETHARYDFSMARNIQENLGIMIQSAGAC